MHSLIYLLKERELGTGLMSISMERTYPDLFRSFDFKKDIIPESDRIWQIQNPYLYKGKMLPRARDLVFIRANYATFCPGRKMTNGFSYLKRHRNLFDRFLPTIYQSDFQVSDVPSIGYYARDCRIQSNMAFCSFAKSLPIGTPVVTMGQRELVEKMMPHNVEWFHTYDQKEFWSSCSHYFYYRCSDMEDPLPHTLLEAIQSRHRIISPKSPDRDFEDGIDDLLSFVQHDEVFDPSKPGEECQILDAKNWRTFISRVSDDDFLVSYPVNRRSFREWAEENL